MAEKKKDEREGSGEQELAGAAAARGVENQAAKQAVALQRAQVFERSREQGAKSRSTDKDCKQERAPMSKVLETGWV